jgi:hypothetical protein
MSKAVKSANFPNKYEIEIEKLRNDNKWGRLREYCGTLPMTKDPKLGKINKKF